ncbi:hypothetical protein FB565_004516 [Actinoplanes lutulentus]|uniref:Uncharacterized protein n=1 Tax=Actinoplanes lutulentus TaxID=1287878 RepID=A0A327ZA38_9ACTN|nr:hypothetical protein [Actinoplanes lutulentus]MBB2944783.1 hypothetical protein [Actinoplanes lutulentus]RAK35423.1 hypothetical protein B0I29_110179 [Actinoplanes lutulentus]
MTGAEFDGVDLDLLADFIGGALIGTPDDERVSVLVADDPVWREAYQRLAPGMAAIGTMLRDLPPDPMPTDLAGRLDALFSTAPTVTAPSQEQAADSVPGKVLDLAEAQRERAAGARPRRRPRWAAPVSIAAGVIAFAGFGLSQISGGDATDSGASLSEAQGAADPDAPMVAMAPAVGSVLQSGFDYDAATLIQEPASLMGSRSASSAAVSSNDVDESAAATKNPLSRLLEPSALADCLDAIARQNGGGPLTVDSVDYAFYTGAPALIVRFAAANGGWVWAVGVACGTPIGDADALAKLPVR